MAAPQVNMSGKIYLYRKLFIKEVDGNTQIYKQTEIDR